jgi:hypothetical protein
MLSASNVKAMLTAGLKPLTYRLRTELAIESWHWNPNGVWSDPARQEGYWISGSKPGAPISLCYGYRLPRRGSTIDHANNDGYSRLDDSDTRTFWKSNPYLDRHFTGEDNARHPQWVIIDLGAKRKINALRILWGEPYATGYTIEFGQGENVNSIEFEGPLPYQKSGEAILRMAAVTARFIRITMTAGSGAAPAGSTDIRDGLGYAIREIYAGFLDSAGRLHDYIRHAADRDRQTRMYVSSTDPWHRAIDRDDRIEQPGFDLVFRSGLTNGMPMLTPAALLYDTPENAAAEVRYLQARNYSVERMELGEEPDGQLTSAEDYAALYAQWAEALHGVDPKLQLGGPGFATIEPAMRPWMDRFLNHLGAHGHAADFRFFSFEWYPFDEVCESAAPQLAKAPHLLTEALTALWKGALSRNIPWIVTEYGYSAYGARAEVDIEGALMNADIAGLALSMGADQIYLYGYEPNELIEERGCTWGNNMLFGMNQDGSIRYRTATYWAARMLTEHWAAAEGVHELYPAVTDSRSLVSAYALRRPDRRWAIMLINKDPAKPARVNLEIHNTRTGGRLPLAPPLDLYQFSREQYVWRAAGEGGHPLRSDPPKHVVLQDPAILLPPYSLSVVLGYRVENL